MMQLSSQKARQICLILAFTGTLLLTLGRNSIFNWYSPLKRLDYFSPYLVKPNAGPQLELLPNLSAMAWPKRNRPNETGKRNKAFAVAFTIGNYRTSQALLQKFQSVMISLNLQDRWFLGGGTLIGSQRHHDVIPWDDDVDIYVDLKYRDVLVKSLTALAPDFGFYESKRFDKFFFSLRPASDVSDPSIIGSFKLSPFPWYWPFVDIFYFDRINETHFCNEWYGKYFFRSADVFPTLYRPLGHKWYPTPRSPLSFLQVYYASDQHLCKSAFYSHATETNKVSVSMPCSKLVGQYAFVQRCPVPEKEQNQLGQAQACDEYLVFGNGTLVHKIRTFLDCSDSKSHFFMVKNNAFSCPKK